MSFYNLPNPWNPGYAIPDYVMAEPPERGTFTTQWLPRGTIPTLVPDFLAKPGQKLLGREDAGLGSLGGCTLAGHTLDTPTLAKPTLSGDSLGAREYELEALGKSLPRRASARQAGQALGADIGALAANPVVMLGAAAGVAYLLLRKKRKGRR